MGDVAVAVSIFYTFYATNKNTKHCFLLADVNKLEFLKSLWRDAIHLSGLICCSARSCFVMTTATRSLSDPTHTHTHIYTHTVLTPCLDQYMWQAHAGMSVAQSGGLSSFNLLWSTTNSTNPSITHTHTPECFQAGWRWAWRLLVVPPFPSLITSASSRFCSDKHSRLD